MVVAVAPWEVEEAPPFWVVQAAVLEWCREVASCDEATPLGGM